MIWLCQITFARIGATGTAQLATPWLAPIMAVLDAAAVGLIRGLLTIRLSDLYVAQRDSVY